MEALFASNQVVDEIHHLPKQIRLSTDFAKDAANYSPARMFGYGLLRKKNSQSIGVNSIPEKPTLCIENCVLSYGHNSALLPVMLAILRYLSEQMFTKIFTKSTPL